MPSFTALMTAIYPVSDLARGKAWYAEAFGVQPYFDQPFYVGFNVAGYELGLIPAADADQPGNRGVVAYWGVADAEAVWARLVALGAAPISPVTDVGEGIRVGTLADPFGNALGIIQNPNFPNAA